MTAHGRDYQGAVAQAEANARYFGRAYFVFTDTSGTVRSEPVHPRVGPYLEVTPHGEHIRHGAWQDG